MSDQAGKKLCPKCKSEVDPKATRCPHCRSKIFVWTLGKKIIAGFVSFIVLLMLIGSVSGSSSSSSSTSNAPVNNVAVGDTAYLRSSADPILVPITKELFDRTMQLAVAQDTTGIAQLVLNGEVLSVKNGTQVKVIGEGFSSSEVRIMSGSHIGESGFVPNEFVSKN